MRFATQNIKNRTLDGRIAMSHKFLVVRYRKREERRSMTFTFITSFAA